MQLIGMLDSPYVRRVAISLQLLGLPFEHRSISVFRTFEQFKGINPVVKAPTLVCDDGTVLMDSTLMLDYAEVLAAAKGTGRSLMPGAPAQRQHALRVIGLALAACEKSVQIIYEQTLRPAEKQHQPWLDRVQGQLLAACAALEAELKRVPPAATSDTIDQAGLTCAVAWQFMQQTRPGLVPVADHPVLQAYSEQVEQLPEFAAAPHGDGTVAARG
jgi:glutathione S-transferase